MLFQNISNIYKQILILSGIQRSKTTIYLQNFQLFYLSQIKQLTIYIFKEQQYLFEYLNIDYQDKHYDGAGEEWFNHDKQQLKTNFPNLPYLIDGQNVITESAVIPVYIIKKHKKYELLGQNSDGSFSEKEIKVLQVITDLRSQIQQEIIKPTFKENRDKLYTEKYSIFIEQKLKRQLGDQQFLFGNVTYADFLLYETLKFFNYVYPKIRALSDYQQRFESIDQIKKYLQSNRFVQNFIPERYLSYFNFQEE